MKNGKKFVWTTFVSAGAEWLTKLYLLVMPLQTIWIYRTVMVGDYKMEYLSFGIYATEIILFLAMIFFGLTQFYLARGRHGKFAFSPDKILILALLVFCGYMYASLFWARDMSAVLYVSRIFMSALVLFVMLLYGVLSFRDFVIYFGLGAVLSALLGIGQFLLQTIPAMKWLGISAQSAAGTSSIVDAGLHAGRYLRAYGPFAHPNIFGGYLSVAIFFLFLQSLRGGVIKYFSVISLPILAAALVFSFSRSAWIGIFLATLVLILEVWKTKKGYLNLIIFWVSFGIFFTTVSPLTFVRLGGNTVTENGSIRERLSALDESKIIIKENRWFGVGAHNFVSAQVNKWPKRLPWENIPVHNSIMLVLAELGLVGFGFIAFVAAAYMHLYTLIFSPRDRTVLWAGVFLLLPPIIFDYYLVASYAGLTILVVTVGALMIDRVSTAQAYASTVHPQPKKEA